MHSTITMAGLGKVKNNFTSYLDSETFNENDILQDSLELKFVTGELEVTRARNVILNATLIKKQHERDNGDVGLLVVTNFKLSFITQQNIKNTSHQGNLFLDPNDVTLQNIDCLYQIIDRKKRILNRTSKISSKIEGIQVICKNFRVLNFNFRRSEVGKAKQIAEALLQFVYPSQHDLLFAYKYNENYYNTLRNISLFNKKLDWTYELSRCGAIGWRVLSLEREDNVPSGSLPMHFVIPRTISEADYFKLANCFRDGRAAIWVFSIQNAALVRMAELIPTITDTRQENTILEIVRKCDPLMRQPNIFDLGKRLPSIQDVQISFTKLRDLFTPDTTRQFMQQDNRFYSYLDKTCWLLYVSLCLQCADEAAESLLSGTTAVLQENDGRDMCCVISSLTQLLLDPFFRTTIGFESLIQKEWVALGHPFSDRLGHVVSDDGSERGPLLLLFLDCVWQLLQQFPEEFEFSETFLTTLWDAAFMPIFDTFLFNCEHDRHVAVNARKVVLRPVWDWAEQFSERDIALFNNPLYKKPVEQLTLTRKSMAVLPSNAIPLPGLHRPINARFSLIPNNTKATKSSPMHSAKVEHRGQLKPNYTIRDLDIWMQCYYRWLSILEIKNGGNIQVDMFNRLTLNNISKMQQELQLRTFDGTTSAASTANNDEENLIKNMPSIGSFYPFTRTTNESNELTDILTMSHEMLTDGSVFDGLSVQQD